MSDPKFQILENFTTS